MALTRTPDSRNTDKIVAGVKEIAVVGQEKKQPIVLRQKIKRNSIVSFIFNSIYVLFFAFSVYLIVRLLDLANFNCKCYYFLVLLGLCQFL